MAVAVWKMPILQNQNIILLPCYRNDFRVLMFTRCLLLFFGRGVFGIATCAVFNLFFLSFSFG